MTKGRPKNDLQQQDQVYPAALQYLARREYAPEELRQRLLRRGADPDAAEEAIARLKENNWLSEERFAASRVRQRRDLSGRGRAAVRAELRALGVDEAVSSAALDEEYDEAREAALAEALADRALSGLDAAADPAARLKKIRSLQRRLLSRGFSQKHVIAATEKYVFALENESE